MRIFLFIITFFIVGCSSRRVEYTLTPSNIASISNTTQTIGVAKVEVPQYLNRDKITIQEGNILKEINANFAAIPTKLLTQNAILSLKRALNNPNVFRYPWDFKAKSGLIVKIVLDEFSYRDGSVIVSGSYYIKNAQNVTLSEKNFSYTKVCSSNSNDIVVTLSELFYQVVLEVAQKIAR